MQRHHIGTVCGDQNKISIHTGADRATLGFTALRISTANGSHAEAFRRRSEIKRVRDCLPDLDCGSCGAPSCQAFAEDIVKGEGSVEDCIVRMRERIQQLGEREETGCDC